MSTMRKLAVPRPLTQAEKLRLGRQVAGPDDRVYAELVLGPCDHPAAPESEADWWVRMHDDCDGADLLRPGVLVLCSCPCHLGVAI